MKPDASTVDNQIQFIISKMDVLLMKHWSRKTNIQHCTTAQHTSESYNMLHESAGTSLKNDDDNL